MLNILQLGRKVKTRFKLIEYLTKNNSAGRNVSLTDFLFFICFSLQFEGVIVIIVIVMNLAIFYLPPSDSITK